LTNVLSALVGFLCRPLVFSAIVLFSPVGASMLCDSLINVSVDGRPLSERQLAQPVRPVMREVVELSRRRGWANDPCKARRVEQLTLTTANEADPRYQHLLNTGKHREITVDEIQRRCLGFSEPEREQAVLSAVEEEGVMQWDAPGAYPFHGSRTDVVSSKVAK
jgi:hypothetical protein